MSDELKGAYAICDMVKKIPSRGITQIVIELPIEYHVHATQMFDGQAVWVELVPPEVARVGRYCIIDGEPVAPGVKMKSAAAPKPYGAEASALYKCGFWLSPKVAAAIGTDDEYRAWIQNRPCIVCGGGDYVEKTGELKCEAAHVKRPSNSGMKHKPEYSCVPLCDGDHIGIQHAHGLPALYVKFLSLRHRHGGAIPEVTENDAREWFDKQRDKHLVEWTTSTLAGKFKVESTGHIPPAKLLRWAQKHEVTEYLPISYASGLHVR